jgi:hypothetical protein
LRLMTNSNFVACCTGRSAALDSAQPGLESHVATL